MWQSIKKRFKELWNVDSLIDLFVDAFLLLFDVITSPILIFVRLIRHFFDKWIKTTIKRFLKWFAHKILRLWKYFCGGWYSSRYFGSRLIMCREDLGFTSNQVDRDTILQIPWNLLPPGRAMWFSVARLWTWLPRLSNQVMPLGQTHFLALL